MYKSELFVVGALSPNSFVEEAYRLKRTWIVNNCWR